MDNKSKQDGRDDSKIDANDAGELSYAAKQAGVTVQQVKDAIRKVGNSRSKVMAELKK